jgi:hypothetical protein
MNLDLMNRFDADVKSVAAALELIRIATSTLPDGQSVGDAFGMLPGAVAAVAERAEIVLRELRIAVVDAETSGSR